MPLEGLQATLMGGPIISLLLPTFPFMQLPDLLMRARATFGRPNVLKSRLVSFLKARPTRFLKLEPLHPLVTIFVICVFMAWLAPTMPQSPVMAFRPRTVRRILVLVRTALLSMGLPSRMVLRAS